MSDPQTESKQAAPKGRGLVLTLLLLLVALALRLPSFTESVWFDELYTTHIYAGHPLVLLKTLFSDIHPPAYFVFISGWIAVFGDSEIAIRIPPLLLGLWSILLVQRLGARLFTPTAGWFAAWGMALSPTHIWYSSEARPYSANIFLALACLWVYLRFRDRSSAKDAQGQKSGLGWLAALGFFLLLTATAWSHYYLAAIPFGFALWEILARSPGGRGRLFASGGAFLMAIGLVGFKAWASKVPISMTYLRPFDWGEWWSLWLVWFPSGNALKPLATEGMWGAGLHRVLPFLWLVLLVAGLWARDKQKARHHLWVVCLAIAIPVGLLILAAAGKDTSYIERSAIPSLPFVYLLMGVGASRIYLGLGRAGKALPIALGAICCTILVAFYQRADQWTVYKPNPDWRGLSSYLVEELPEDGSTTHIYSDYVAPTSLTYYDARYQQAKNFEFNTAKWERAENRLGGVPLVGGLLESTIRELRTDWIARDAIVREQTRALIHELRFAPPNLDEPTRGPSWLLVFGAPSERATALMQNPRVQVGDPVHRRSLVLYPLSW